MDGLPRVQNRHGGDFAGCAAAADMTAQQSARLMSDASGDIEMNGLERSVP